MTTALFLGRFQPVPHRGHVQVLQEILAHCDRVIIGLGSSQYSGTFDHSCTVEERREAFEALLVSLGVPRDRYDIVPIPDIHDDDRYVAHVKQLVPSFDVVYSGNELVQRLFAEQGFMVVPLERYGGHRGTDIRTKMKRGDKSYRDMIPEPCLHLLDAWDIPSRLNRI